MKGSSPNRKMEGRRYPEYNEQRFLLLLDSQRFLISEHVVLWRGAYEGENAVIVLA